VSESDGRLARGLATRREVLGDEHVARSMTGATEFTAAAQEFVTEYCWGDVWTRPGLDRRTRSLINLAMLTALNRMHEFRVHVRGAVNNGCTVEEIRETLRQAIVYCGAPAGLESFREAQAVLDELAAERDGAPA
jgi:4-carboxymuconolactone decarboxylase